jgi:hypothetical protein
MVTLLTLIGFACAGFLIAAAAIPIQLLKQKLNIHNEAIAKNQWHSLIIELCNCPLCLSFWLGLITGNILYACTISVMSEIIYRLMNRI